MKRLAALALGLVLLAAAAWAELGYRTFVATSAGAQTFTINSGTLVVINDGASEVYVRIFWSGETAADATSSNAEIKSGESFTFSKENVSQISAICATGETATIRLFYW